MVEPVWPKRAPVWDSRSLSEVPEWLLLPSFNSSKLGLGHTLKEKKLQEHCTMVRMRKMETSLWWSCRCFGHAPTPPSLIPGRSVPSPAPPESYPKPEGGLSITRSISVLQCATFPQRQGVLFLLKGSFSPTGSRSASSPFPHGPAARDQLHLSQLLNASPLQGKTILQSPKPFLMWAL